jgi:hypothetical protein
VAVSLDGSKVFVTGVSDGQAGDPDYATVAYGADDGSNLWVARYDGGGAGWDAGEFVGISPDGSKVFVTGWSYGPRNHTDFLTIGYDATTGGSLWTQRYDDLSGGSDEPKNFAVSPDGSTVFVTGWSDDANHTLDYATLAYDAGTGNRRWLQRYAGSGGGHDYVYGLAVSPDGSRVFVTGESFEIGGVGYTTLAYDGESGNRLWLRRFSGLGGGGRGLAVAASPDSRSVFVTGYCQTLRRDDYCTVGYVADTGAGLGAKAFGGPNEDEPTAIAVSPDGTRVFVTGYVATNENGYDYGTVAYEV